MTVVREEEGRGETEGEGEGGLPQDRGCEPHIVR